MSMLHAYSKFYMKNVKPLAHKSDEFERDVREIFLSFQKNGLNIYKKTFQEDYELSCYLEKLVYF